MEIAKVKEELREWVADAMWCEVHEDDEEGAVALLVDSGIPDSADIYTELQDLGYDAGVAYIKKEIAGWTVAQLLEWTGYATTAEFVAIIEEDN